MGAQTTNQSSFVYKRREPEKTLLYSALVSGIEPLLMTCILAAVPGQMGIGVYSPLVDRQGNSVRGVRVFKDLERALNLHIFH